MSTVYVTALMTFAIMVKIGIYNHIMKRLKQSEWRVSNGLD